jgi:hypothetical protein
MANPQPDICPKRWNLSPVRGSDSTLVPDAPVVVVSCTGPNRKVVQGSQLTTLIEALNGVRILDPPPPPCTPVGGLVVIHTQLYFNYPSGDRQLILLSRDCRTVTNGKITAKLTQSLAGSI